MCNLHPALVQEIVLYIYRAMQARFFYLSPPIV